MYAASQSTGIVVSLWSRILNNGSLVISNLPTFGSCPPDRHPPSETRVVLQQRVSQQVHVFCQLSAMEVPRLPGIRVRDRVALFQHVQHGLAGVAAARGAGLPEIVSRHPLEIGPRCSKFGPVKDGGR